MLRTRRLVAVGATSLAMVLVGCGGDDGGGSSSGSGDFCDLAGDVEKASDDLANFQDPDEVEKAYNEFVDKAEAAAKKAPSEIKDEMNDSVAAFKKLIKILEDNDWDLEATGNDPKFEELQSDESFDETSSDVEAFLSDECPEIYESNGDDTETTEIVDDETDEDTTDTTEATDDTSGSGDAVTDAQVEAIKRVFPKLNDDQAKCFVEHGMDAASAQDSQAILQVLSDCDIELTDLQP